MKSDKIIQLIALAIIIASFGLIVYSHQSSLPSIPTYPPTQPPSQPPQLPSKPTPTPTPIHHPAGTITYLKTEFEDPSTGVKGKQIKVKVGSEVKVYVTVEAVGGSVNGVLTVEIRADFTGVDFADEHVVNFTKHISLQDGETKTIYMGTFTANYLTGKNYGDPVFTHIFREYFVKVYFNGKCIYNPINPDLREWVKTYGATGTVTYVGTEYEAPTGHT